MSNSRSFLDRTDLVATAWMAVAALAVAACALSGVVMLMTAAEYASYGGKASPAGLVLILLSPLAGLVPFSIGAAFRRADRIAALLGEDTQQSSARPAARKSAW